MVTLRRDNIVMCMSEKNDKTIFTFWLDDLYKVRYEELMYTLYRRKEPHYIEYETILKSSIIDNILLKYKKLVE